MREFRGHSIAASSDRFETIRKSACRWFDSIPGHYLMRALTAFSTWSCPYTAAQTDSGPAYAGGPRMRRGDHAKRPRLTPSR
jgi:hypothetical protein